MRFVDQQRLGELYERRGGQVRAYVRRALRDPDVAEDITAQAFTRLGEKMVAGRAGDLEELLPLIVSGLVIDHQRAAARRPQPVGLDRELRAVEPGLHWRSLQPGLSDFPVTFNQALRALPDNERDAFILTELRGLTVREAAAVLDAPRSTVADRAEAARNFLREEIS